MSNSNDSTQFSTASVAAKVVGGPSTRDGYRPGHEQRAEIILGPTGRFRPIIEDYLATVAPSSYQPKDLNTVRMSIGMFFRFVVQDLHIDDLDLIRPSTITRYIDQRRGLGYKSFTFLGHLASFFSWLAYSGEYDRGNPVIRWYHRERMSAPFNNHAHADAACN